MKKAFFLIMIVCSLFMMIGCHNYEWEKPPAMIIKQGVQISFGKSMKFDNGKYFRLNHPWDSIYWEKLQLPLIRLEKAEKVVWIRFRLPNVKWPEPTVKINGQFAAKKMAIFVGDQKIAQCTPFCREGRYANQIFSLPKNARNQILTIRIEPEQPFHPELNSFTLASAGDNFLRTLFDQFEMPLLGFFLLFMSIFRLTISFKKEQIKTALGLALFECPIGIIVLLWWPLGQLLFPNEQLREFATRTVILLVPIGLAFFFEQIFGFGYQKIIRRIWQFQIINALCLFTFPIIGVLTEEQSDKVFQTFLATEVFVLSIFMLFKIVAGEKNAIILLLGFGFFSISILADVFYQFRIVEAHYGPNPLMGVFVFALSLSFVLSQHIKSMNRQIEKISQASIRFVPIEFLEQLEKKDITEVNLGDQVNKEMTILFSDVRSFSQLSENMTPEENFRFLNSYLAQMEPIIRLNHGFIDKYIGDAIMALFSNVDSSVRGAVEMLLSLKRYNENRRRAGYLPISIGIGLNTGSLMLGTIGAHNRMEGTVISDAVNLAARIESLTKYYGTSLLISHHTYNRLQKPEDFTMRLIDRVQVVGKKKPIAIWEVLDGESEEKLVLKSGSLGVFEAAMDQYMAREFSQAKLLFSDCIQKSQEDKVARIYVERCENFLRETPNRNWNGVTVMNNK